MLSGKVGLGGVGSPRGISRAQPVMAIIQKHLSAEINPRILLNVALKSSLVVALFVRTRMGFVFNASLGYYSSLSIFCLLLKLRTLALL